MAHPSYGDMTVFAARGDAAAKKFNVAMPTPH